MAEPVGEGAGDVDRIAPDEAGGEAAPPDAAATVGTGTSIAIGCVVVALVLLLIAFALRAFTNFW